MEASSLENSPQALLRELEASQMHLRSVIEHNADGILVVCPQGCIRFANPAACALLERPCGELLGELFGVPIIPGETTEIDIPLAGGGVRIAEMRVVETEWEGQPACLASLRDITEHRRLEEQLREQAEELAEANRRKDEFLALLSHELRNPLAPIRNSARILTSLGLADPAAGRHVAVIERQARHLARLVDDLLDVFRVTRGQIPLQQETIELRSQVIEPALELAQAFVRAEQQHLEVRLPPGPVYLHGDAARLQQVVSNLLNNAAKYTPDGGRIWLSVEVEGRESVPTPTPPHSHTPTRAVIRVRDTGIGIDPELLPNIFDMFVQADHSLDRAKGGLGVGLTLVRSLVEQHGGEITASSAGPGQGSEFIVSLPMRSASGECRMSNVIQHSTLVTRTSKRVLVVDDNSDAAETLADLLGTWGHQVRTASDGRKALQLVAEYRPEVVLLDLGLPGLDGYAVARELRQRGLRDGLLLVAATGYGQAADRVRTAEAGFDRHLVKPIDPEELRQLLEGSGAEETR